MTYKLFIDDERDPITEDWVIARSSTEAINAIMKFGMPIEIAFDHDLGGTDTSILFIRKLIELVLDGDIAMPHDFKFNVHSQNPIGAQNIKFLMRGLLEHIVTSMEQ